MAGPVRRAFQRFLELVLDQASAKKLEKDTQDALKKATDPKSVAKNVASIAKGVARDLAAIGGAVAAATAGLMKMAQRGQEVAGVQAAFARVTGDSEGAINLLRKATRGLISDYDLMVGLNKSVSLGASKNAEDFAALASTAQQLGRALGVDAAYALDSLNIGIARSSRLYLDNIGIIVDVDEANREYAKTLGKTVSELTAAERKEAFRNVALREARELVDQLGTSQDRAAESAARFSAQIANIKNNLSLAVAQSPFVQRYFEGLALTLRDMSDGGLELSIIAEGLPRDLRGLQERFKGVGREAEIMREKIDAAIRDEPATGGGKLGTKLRAELKLLEAEAELIGRRITVVAGLQPGVDPTDPTAPPDPEKVRKAQDERLKFLEEAAKLGILHKDEQRELWNIYIESNKALLAGNVGLEERIRLTARARAALAAAGGVTGTGRAVAQGTGMAAIPLTLTAQSPDFHFGEESPTTKFLLDNFAEITSAGQTAALGIQSAFQDAFLALGDEGNAFANFFGTLFEGMAAGVLASIAQIASAKVVENTAYAIQSLAQGFLFKDPEAFKAAALFGEAAATWGLVGGIAGAAASGVSGGGGATTFRGSDAVGRRIDQLDRAGGDVIIYVNPFDANDPRQQAAVGKASQQYQQRTGGTIRYRPYPPSGQGGR